MTVPTEAAAHVFVGAFVDELARAGVRHVCIAPGSRSTPLALLMARHPRLRIWTHIDERSAGFFALGMARALGERGSVALLCTSGTAAVNYFPAVVEAHSAGVPLVVLTADRPPELRGVSAPQTIDQQRLFGGYAKWFVDVALPEVSTPLLRYVRTLACRAVATSIAVPAGPVHLNFAFREPLVPVEHTPPHELSAENAYAWHGRSDGAPWVRVAEGVSELALDEAERLGNRLRRARHPLVVCGPQFDAQLAAPLAALAATLRAPLLADPLSQLRWGTHDRSAIVDRYDAMLRDERMANAFAPDLVLRIGAPPTSKALQHFLERHAAAVNIVVDAARWPDPLHLAAELVRAEPRRCAEQLLSVLEGATDAAHDWLPRWCHANAAAGAALAIFCENADEPFEGRALAEVSALLPANGTLVVSSSMPVRDLDSFAGGDARMLRVFANRGANGIDGVVSTALGVAAVARELEGGPVVLVIGDLAFYHDMNGLLAARLHELDLTIVVLNNDGGGIFSFLPQAAHNEHFEHLFGTPHGLNFSPVAALYGANYTLAGTWESFGEAVEGGIASGGLHIVEMRTDRARNVTLHRDAWEAVARRLELDTSPSMA